MKIDLRKQLHDHVLSMGYIVAEIELSCPLCHNPLTIRTNQTSREQFWGCTAYPTCTHTGRLWKGIQELQDAYKQAITELSQDGDDAMEELVEWDQVQELSKLYETMNHAGIGLNEWEP